MTSRPLFRLSVIAVATGLIACPLAAQEEPREEEATEAPVEVAQEAPREAEGRSERAVPTESFLESITVTATRGERNVKDVPATVSVIDAERLERELATTLGDLVRYEPGVYVSSSVERLGPGGFNIRGVGGNRVLTRVDGIPTAEEFEFGHFEVPSYAVDFEALDRIEILRGPASSLYGSDALGGVVSFDTKDPVDYTGGTDGAYVGLRLTWDGRYSRLGEALTLAGGSERWQASAVFTHSSAEERDNQGDIETEDSSRTAPNPQDRNHLGLLAKMTHRVSDSSRLELALEALDRETDTQVLSSQGVTNLGAIFGFPPSIVYLVDKPLVEANDQQDRLRLSLEQSLVGTLTDQFLWRVHWQSSDTEQHTSEIRSTTKAGGPFGAPSTVDVLREGLMTFEQETVGAEIQAQQEFELGGSQLLTFGSTYNIDSFDQLRNRVETDMDSGEDVPNAEGLIFPTKYFPESDVTELGLYAQAEMTLANGRITLVPGLRYDYYDLAVNANDPVYLAGNLGTPAPVEFSESAVSPKLGVLASVARNWVIHAQASHGFRAPPFSHVNSGFTHLAGGVTRLPNPDLRPETSDGVELGVRGSWGRGGFGVTGYTTRYEDFIELVTLGLNPETGLIEFQQRNVAEARISGIEAAADLALARGWLLRAALSWSEGEDRTRSVPLNSIHPPELVLGVRRDWASGRWSTELVTRLVASKDESNLDNTEVEQYATPAYQVVDIFAGWQISRKVSLNAGILNLLDETYWEWTDALGQQAGSPALDRFTAPGRSATIALRYSR